jgi:SAM-dependent methyltransferase
VLCERRSGSQHREVRRRFGVTKARFEFRGASTGALRLLRRSLAVPVVKASDVLFDLRRGIRTRGTRQNDSAVVARSWGGDPYDYQGTHLLFWRRLHSAIPITPAAATFVDLGAGRGRAVILAAETGFGRVTGVELDPELAKEAEDNVRRWRLRRRATPPPHQEVVIVQGDAAAYRLPDGPLVVWLYNPFGATTMRQVLRRLCETARRADVPIFVAYFNPVHQAVFEEFERLTVHARAKRWVVYRLDAALPDLGPAEPGSTVAPVGEENALTGSPARSARPPRAAMMARPRKNHRKRES